MPVPPASDTVCAPLGTPMPPIPYAFLVSMPKWSDVVGPETEEKRDLGAICTGYPRFFINKSIQELAGIYERKYGAEGERCLLFPKASIASQCRAYVLAQSPKESPVPMVRLLGALASRSTANVNEGIALHLVFVPEEVYPLAKKMWLYTGLGITQRMADRCLALLGDDTATFTVLEDQDTQESGLMQSISSANDIPQNRYGRGDISLTAGMVAKRALRQRIARLATYEASLFGTINVCDDDVYLFPTGMASIWSTHQLFLSAFPPAPSVCFGFPYTDTLGIIQHWGSGYHFFDKGDGADIGNLESLLSSPDVPHILALFCEFPSNPLLRSPDLIRLRELADRYGFPIVIDGTIGNFVNVDLLPFADILVNSLTKAFSGQANVMGGSLVLNPKSRYYSALKPKMDAMYEDSYWEDDAICMEHNSRDFIERLRVMNRNAEAVCDFLRFRLNKDGSVVKRVYYPKTETRAVYDVYQRLFPTSSDGQEKDNFGGLLSVTFTSLVAAAAFYDALPCAKGPSFGTNFTLACPYTVMVHLNDLEWAATCGVEESLVRISVGLEDQELLLDWIRTSLKHAEEAVLKAR